MWRKWLCGAGCAALLAAAPVPRALPAAGDALAPAAGRFLVAGRGMADPRFARTVILLVDYGPGGALGLIVNRPTVIALPRAFPHVEELRGSDGVLWLGGPVQPAHAAILTDAPDPQGQSRKVLETLRYSTDMTLLRALAATGGGTRFRVYAGYSGWGPSQLDSELARGDWRVVPASVEQAFTGDGDALWRELVGARGTWVRGGAGHSFSRATSTPTSAPPSSTLARSTMGRQHTVQSSTISTPPAEQSTTRHWRCQHQGQVTSTDSSMSGGTDAAGGRRGGRSHLAAAPPACA